MVLINKHGKNKMLLLLSLGKIHKVFTSSCDRGQIVVAFMFHLVLAKSETPFGIWEACLLMADIYLARVRD